jgi:predicted nucleic acid-binding protein
VGLTVLDAGVVIAILDASDVHHAAAAAAVTTARERGDTLVLPSSAYAECLVSPCRRGPEAVAVVDSFVDALPARVEPASRAIASTAAELRARHAGALRLPDALVVATALVVGADRVITTDAGWPALSVPVEVLAPAE